MEIEAVSEVFKKIRLLWMGHVRRMKSNEIPAMAIKLDSSSPNET